MKVIGDRQFVEVPGDATHELPPLLVRKRPEVERLDRVMRMAQELVEQEDLVPAPEITVDRARLEFERNRMDLAINLVEQYLAFVAHWQWGHDILEWIRQCELTFETSKALRNLLRPDVWPHAGRSSFVRLLEDREVPHANIRLSQAVGLRLTFRQPPPLECFSDQFLFYLNSPVATSAYEAWAARSPQPHASLPPERFLVRMIEL